MEISQVFLSVVDQEKKITFSGLKNIGVYINHLFVLGQKQNPLIVEIYPSRNAQAMFFKLVMRL